MPDWLEDVLAVATTWTAIVAVGGLLYLAGLM